MFRQILKAIFLQYCYCIIIFSVTNMQLIIYSQFQLNMMKINIIELLFSFNFYFSSLYIRVYRLNVMCILSMLEMFLKFLGYYI